LNDWPTLSRRFCSALALAWVLGLASCGPSPSWREPGPIPVDGDPVQEAVSQAQNIVLKRSGWEWTIMPRASYILRGIVLSKEPYHAGPIAALSPWDVAMAWGRLAENDLFRKISWSQMSRWYVWAYGGDFTRGNDFIARWSSNTHLIPASSRLKGAVGTLSRRKAAELTGFLVSVHGVKGGQSWDWNSSLSREDHGDGSCEVMYLTRLKTEGKVYE
jgi:hypothetical protein